MNPSTASDRTTMETATDRFPRPDWPVLWASLEPLSDDDERREAWCKHGHKWLCETAAVLGADFGVHEIGCFWIVSNRAASDVQRMGRLLLSARKRILADLEGIAADPIFARLAVLWLEDNSQYYEYVAHFYPDSGEFGFSGGMFLRAGYPHFVFPHYDEIWQLEHVIAHELTHALVSHLMLPLWLDEGMAVMLEEMIAGASGPLFDPKDTERHREFWDATTIQEFWSGASFSRSDEGHELSYALAKLLAVNFGHDYARYRELVLVANWEDAGEGAARDVFGIGLGDLIGEILGPGTWSPDPTKWKDTSTALSDAE
jgi:hypothetical protein